MKSLKNKSFTNSIKGFVCSKTFIMFAIVSCIAISSTFAASSDNTITTLDSWGNKILSIFSSGWVKALACVALIVEAIGMIVSGQQGGGGAIIKKFAPWIIGTIILLCASGITSYFMGDLEFEEFSYAVPAAESFLA